MATAVITGGSSGLGLQFATELASRGYRLVLIAREESRLVKVCRKLSRQYGVDVQPVVIDLTDQASVQMLADMISQIGDLSYMVNNAGFAIHADAGDSSEATYQLQRDAVTVMVTNVLVLSTAAATAMRKNDAGHIINIASTAAWTFQGNYSAIKRYVLTYTQSLALSLEGSGITATAVCPAWMHTNFHKSAGLGEPAIPEWLYVRPDQVVQQGLAGAENGRRVVIPTLRWRFIVWVLAHGPVALRRHMTRAYLSSDNYRHKSHRRQR